MRVHTGFPRLATKIPAVKRSRRNRRRVRHVGKLPPSKLARPTAWTGSGVETGPARTWAVASLTTVARPVGPAVAVAVATEHPVGSPPCAPFVMTQWPVVNPAMISCRHPGGSGPAGAASRSVPTKGAVVSASPQRARPSPAWQRGCVVTDGIDEPGRWCQGCRAEPGDPG